MKKTLAPLACVLLLAGCKPDKAPADLAIKAAEHAIQAVADEAGKYVPEKLEQTEDALAAAKEKFAKGDYEEALGAATDLANTAKGLAVAAAAKKDELTKAWNDLATSIPNTVASLQAKIEELGKAKKLPKGLDAAKLARAREALAALSKSWEEASAAFDAGNLGEALGRASGLKEKGDEVLALLGMAPPADAPAAAPVE